MPLVVFGGISTDVDAVLFDKDGTLFDAVALWKELGRERLRLIALSGAAPGAVSLAAKAMGFEPETGVADRSGPLALATWRDEAIAVATGLYLAGFPWTRARRIAVEAYERAEREIDISRVTALLPGVAGSLRSLANAGVVTAVVTTDSRERSQRMLECAGIRDLVKAIVGSEDFSRSKPDPEPLLKACTILGVSPERCAYVGDSPSDMIAAANAGMCVRAAVLTGTGDAGSLAPLSSVVLESVAGIRPATDTRPATGTRRTTTARPAATTRPAAGG
ncbi:MAG: HAD family hydrolase [Firmicutes bacterium]|nr:HAD family hydrolase [Bacillota bacterium]